MNFMGGPSYEAVVRQTPMYNTTVHVGNLVPYCTQADLIPLFQSIGDVLEIRMQPEADRGFAFVKMDTHGNAAMAIVQLQGQIVHGRPIACRWGKERLDAAAAPPHSYDTVARQTPPYNTTVHVGNLVSYCTKADLIPLFRSIGDLSEIRMQADRGIAFVKMDTHEHAAKAIAELHGEMVHGRPIKCSWEKERADTGTLLLQSLSFTPSAAAPYTNMVRTNASPFDPFELISFQPMYDVPQSGAYRHYGFNGCPANPSGAAPGMQQAAPGAAAGQTAPGADVGVFGQAAQAQRAGDPSSYYSDYRGGRYPRR
jgi:nucleolysin TIA-1/TIAR